MCVCMYIYVYMHTRVCTHTWIHIFSHTSMYTHFVAQFEIHKKRNSVYTYRTYVNKLTSTALSQMHLRCNL